ncbi:MAG: NAD-dependent epimerase/dehydratase family protein [Mycobacteriales bacterium]
MRPRRVLITGVSRFLGSELARRLAAAPGIEHVVGVDSAAPLRDLGQAEFVRADIRNPLIAKILSAAAVDTVVHLNVVATPTGAGGRATMKEINVIGTMQVLAAAQKSATVRKLVVKSSTAVYGCSPSDPAVFTEDMQPSSVPYGYAKDATEVEGYVRGFARRRPEVEITTLRFANVIGPRGDSVLARFFASPVVPVPFGFDPRLQLLHEDDALEVLQRATLRDRAGTFNVGAAGVVLLSQAVRRAGRLPLPVVGPSALVGRLARGFGLAGFSPEQLATLKHAPVADTARLRTVFDFSPAYTSIEAFDDFAAGCGVPALYTPSSVADVEQSINRVLSGLVSTNG